MVPALGFVHSRPTLVRSRPERCEILPFCSPTRPTRCAVFGSPCCDVVAGAGLARAVGRLLQCYGAGCDGASPASGQIDPPPAKCYKLTTLFSCSLCAREAA